MRTATTLAITFSLFAQHAMACTAPAMLVFDASASMDERRHDRPERTRIVAAREAVAEAMPEITPFRQVGLVVYGPGGTGHCAGVSTRLEPAPDRAMDIIFEVNGIQPRGMTPIAASVAHAATELDYRNFAGDIVLVTDGNENCGGSPCALGAQLAAEARDLTIHVIGFRVVEQSFNRNWPNAEKYVEGKTMAKCLADQTGGTFVSADSVDELILALQETMGCMLVSGVEHEIARLPG